MSTAAPPEPLAVAPLLRPAREPDAGGAGATPSSAASFPDTPWGETAAAAWWRAHHPGT